MLDNHHHHHHHHPTLTPALSRPAGEGVNLGVRWPARLTLRAQREGAATRVHAAHEGPLRLLKTLYPEGPGLAHAVLVHPPGGLVGGDQLDIQLQLDPGAHLLVTNPAATRFYRSVAGAAAQQVSGELAAGARLEWLPQETLAHSGCNARNEWRFRLAEGASLFALELLALGLHESQQPFEAGRFVQHFELPGLWRERGVIDATDHALMHGPCGLAGYRVMGTLLFAQGNAIALPMIEALLGLARAAAGEASVAGAMGPGKAGSGSGKPTLLAGATALQGRLVLLRVLAQEVEPAVRLLRSVWALWRQQTWGLVHDAPRIWAS